MKIHALMTIKNESDIVRKTLNHALQWADKIYIIDNGSTDDTVSVISEIMKNTDKIKLSSYNGHFYEGLRGMAFRSIENVDPGDWVCRLDADEIYIDDPKEFISMLDKKVDHIFSASFQYYMVEEDIDKEKIDVEDMLWYKCNHSEIRFVKIKKNSIWPKVFSWPIFLVSKSQNLIKLKHYQYRGKVQNERRMLDRKLPGLMKLFNHENCSIEGWYTCRNFKIPKDMHLQYNRVVDKEDLESSKNYLIPSTLKKDNYIKTHLRIFKVAAGDILIKIRNHI